MNFFFENRENARRRYMPRLAGANRRASDPHPVSINIKRLLWHADDDNDWSSGRDLGFPNIIARTERRKWGLRSTLSESGSSRPRRD